MVLIDQSGSVNGLVRDSVSSADPGGFKEERDPPSFPPNFRDVASDPDNLRLGVTKGLLRTLNDADQVGVLGFSEQTGLVVPCAASVGDPQADLASCFGAQSREIWFGPADGINGLAGRGGGRSNLWLAVKTAYDFLRAKGDHVRSNHIIVLTDGPDTCAGEGRGSCQTPCLTSDFSALSEQVVADRDDPARPKIQVHFVQFESLGYPGRDPRQVELSCVSGGHYQFINSNRFSRAQSHDFQTAFGRAVVNIRHALMGHWELASAVPVYASHGGGGAGVPPGDLYGLEGLLVIKPSSNLIASGVETSFPFGFGIAPNPAESTPDWDRRPTVRKPCGGFTFCGASDSPGACEVVCSPETLTCLSGSTPTPQPDLAQCSPSQGVSGFCCGGSCQTGGTCASCSQ
jgi:hypothetical protein